MLNRALRNFAPLATLRLLSMGCILLLTPYLHSQNFDKIGKKDMVTVGGGMNFNTIFYDATGMSSRRDPYTWYFNGNLNVNILDVSLPFTFSYTNNRGTYTQPFNMQSCSPRYKWAQTHIGTTSMNFSSYTLSGHIFTGAGIELTPNGFYIGGMYGRLNRSVNYDYENNSADGMSFKRMGYAFKLGYDDDGRSIGATYFSAKDDPASLLFIPTDVQLHPQQNTALSLNGKIKLLEVLSLEGEFAVSGITRDLNSLNESTTFNGWQKWMLPTKSTTSFFKAYKASIAFNQKNYSISINHEHVDPDYETFGAYYFNNDIENWTIAPSFRFFKGKLNVALNSGIQRNNLDESKLTTMHHWVGSINISTSPFRWLTGNASYSNFTSYTNKRPQTDPFWQPSPTDTLSFYQLSQQGNGSIIFSFGKRNIKHNISVITSYQQTQQQQSNGSLTTNILNGNLAYTFQLPQKKFSATLLSNFNRSVADTLITQFYGPGIQWSQSLLQGQLRFSAGTVYNLSTINSALQSNIMSHRAQFSYSPKVKNKKYGRPSFALNAIYVQKFPVMANQNTTGELTVTGNVAYSF